MNLSAAASALPFEQLRQGRIDLARSVDRIRRSARVLRHRNFTLLWVGGFVSSVGSWMQDLTVPLVVLWATGSATWVGIAAAAEFVPALLLAPVGGVLADRLSPRRLLFATQTSAVVLAAALWHTVRGGTVEPGSVIALVAAGRALHSLSVPALQCLLPNLVPRDDLPRAVALNSARLNASRPAGFFFATVCIAWFGAEWVFLSNAFSYLVALASFAFISVHPPRPARCTSLRRSIEQLRNNTAFVQLIGTTVVVSFLGGPVVQLLPVIAERAFGAESTGYGALATTFGLGALIASLGFPDDSTGTWWPRVAAHGVVAYGLALLALAMAPWYGAALVLLLLLGYAYLVIFSALNISIHLLCGEAVRGRAIAMYMSAAMVGFGAGAFLQGWLTDRIGFRSTLTIAGGLLLAYGWHTSRYRPTPESEPPLVL